jgi:hypothetical protein
MERKVRRITLGGVLRLINDVTEEMFPIDRISAHRRFYAPKYFDLEDYFPSEVERVVEKLVRKGWVEKVDTPEGVKVILTDNGKKQILLYKLDELKPKSGLWDGKWRMVFFDVEERDRKKRNELRKYLDKLGFKKMQESVFVCPYDCSKEVEYIREVLDIPHGVKLGLLEKIENDDDLRKWFGL